MIGSTEWVEEYAPWLRETAISYLNLDIAVAGPLPGAGATPELRTLALEVMKKIIYGNRTLYDAWDDLNQFEPEDNGFTNLGSGSDYTAFLQLGIGVLDFGMDGEIHSPVYHYHSNYDSYHWMKTVDPDYSIHATVGQFMTLLAYHLTDDSIIPFDISAYARNINYWVRDLISEVKNFDPEYAHLQKQIAIPELDRAAKAFQKAADQFAKKTTSRDKNNSEVQAINDALKAVQGLFIREEGLPGRLFYKNALYAPNRDDGYRAQTLPGSMEALQDRRFDLCHDWNMWLAGALDKASILLGGR